LDTSSQAGASGAIRCDAAKIHRVFANEQGVAIDRSSSMGSLASSASRLAMSASAHVAISHICRLDTVPLIVRLHFGEAIRLRQFSILLVAEQTKAVFREDCVFDRPVSGSLISNRESDLLAAGGECEL
jgi:hypothetical protein